MQRPVVIIGVTLLATVIADLDHAFFHDLGHTHGIIFHDLVVLTHLLSQSLHQELVDAAEITVTGFGLGKYHRQTDIGTGRIHQRTQQKQDLFQRTHPAREYNDTVSHAYKGFQTHFDVWHHNQMVNDGVG